MASVQDRICNVVPEQMERACRQGHLGTSGFQACTLLLRCAGCSAGLGTPRAVVVAQRNRQRHVCFRSAGFGQQVFELGLVGS